MHLFSKGNNIEINLIIICTWPTWGGTWKSLQGQCRGLIETIEQFGLFTWKLLCHLSIGMWYFYHKERHGDKVLRVSLEMCDGWSKAGSWSVGRATKGGWRHTAALLFSSFCPHKPLQHTTCSISIKLSSIPIGKPIICVFLSSSLVIFLTQKMMMESSLQNASHSPPHTSLHAPHHYS